MKTTMGWLLFVAVISLGTAVGACGGENEADRLGVGAECVASDECDEDTFQSCLIGFKGGYCGIQGCASDDDCPEASACITHDDSQNYCFRVCVDKVDCNANRSVDNESNCSASVVFTDGADGRKACVPPTGS